jgi:uncharacterized small protein (DUF1192 family)
MATATKQQEVRLAPEMLQSLIQEQVAPLQEEAASLRAELQKVKQAAEQTAPPLFAPDTTVGRDARAIAQGMTPGSSRRTRDVVHVDRKGIRFTEQDLARNPMRFQVGQIVRINPDVVRDENPNNIRPWECPQCNRRFAGNLRNNECSFCGIEVVRVDAGGKSWAKVFPQCKSPEYVGEIKHPPYLTSYGWKYHCVFPGLTRKDGTDGFHERELLPATA